MSEDVEGYERELHRIAQEDQAEAANDPDYGEYLPGDDEAGQAPPDQQAVELVATLAKLTGELVAARRGAHWQLAEREAQAWAEAAVPVIEKYAPDFQASPELALALCTGMLVLPRLQKDRAVIMERYRAQQEQEAANDAGDTGYQSAEPA